MSLSLIPYSLLFLGIFLPSQTWGQQFSSPPRPPRGSPHHHSHLDTDPDLELSPVRPGFHMGSRRTTMRDWTIHLPTVPSIPDELMEDKGDYEDSYDYNWLGESSGSAATVSAVAATQEEDEYVDPLDGYRDRIKSGSSEVIVAWFLSFLPLMISMAALLLPL